MTKEEKQALFTKAMGDRRKKIEQKQTDNSWFLGGLFWAALSPYEQPDMVVRLVGLPHSRRQSETDSKVFPFSKIKNDLGKYFYCVWPNKDENSDWLLYRVFDLVTEGFWEEDSAGKRCKKFIYAEEHKDIVSRVTKNSDLHKFAKGWTPKGTFLINVIDRSDMDWHRENKKTKLLSKSSFEIGKTKSIGFEFGVTEYLSNVIMDSLVNYYGSWEEYDIAIRRTKDDPWYHAFNCEKEPEKLDEFTQDVWVQGDITSEESEWERQDIDAITQVTSYTKLKKQLGIIFTDIDKGFKTTFLEELNDLVSDEKKEAAQRRASAKILKQAPPPPVDSPDPEPAPVTSRVGVPPPPEPDPTVDPPEPAAETPPPELPPRPVETSEKKISQLKTGGDRLESESKTATYDGKTFEEMLEAARLKKTKEFSQSSG